MPGSRRSRLISIAISASLGLASVACYVTDAAATGRKAEVHRAATDDVIVTRNPFGKLGTASTNAFNGGSTNAFFTPLGTNGRTCATCHVVDDDYSISPTTAKKVARQDFRDPLFDPVDGGSNCPPEDPNQLPDARNAGMLLNYALIREQIAIPANAEFSLRYATNPHRCLIAPGSPELSGKLVLFRRPLPSTNLHFLSDVRWDGRATVQPITTGTNFSNIGPLVADLASQANTASIGHELSPPIVGTQALADMVEFERNLFSAQISLGPLRDLGDRSGPIYLASSVAPAFSTGQNDPFGSNFSRNVFTLFADWEPDFKTRRGDRDMDRLAPLQRAIGEGERIFNNRSFVIANVKGLNSAANDPLYNSADPLAGQQIVGTCSVCHNTPNVGNHSKPLMLNIGVADAVPLDNRGRPIFGVLDTRSLPVYTLASSTRSVVRVTDPARALITGRWTDIGKVKVPVLRGLGARPPYFHNGAARDLTAVVAFHNSRFNIGLTPDESRALTLFLSAL